MSQKTGNTLEFDRGRAPAGPSELPFRASGSARPGRFRATRLLCAQVYLLGLVASLPTLHRLLGPSFRGIEREVGYDRRALLFHSLQSLLLSLALLVPLALVWAFGDAGSGAFPVVALGCLLTKIAVLNPWLAWLHFRKADGADDLRLPLLAGMARELAELALPRSTTASQDTVYFSGARPFVGYGSEVNSWTLVVDTTSRSKSLGALLPPQDEPDSLSACELYRTIVERVRRIGARDVKVSAGLFLKGESSGEIKEAHGYKYGRPPSALAGSLARTIDGEGTRGRNYMILQSASPTQDLVVTQFVRFQQKGKLIFCEFASYVLSPVQRGLALLDRLFELHPVLYALLGGALFGAAALGSMAVARTLVAFWSTPAAALARLRGVSGWVELILSTPVAGGVAFQMLLASVALVVAFAAVRLASAISGAVAIGLGLRKDLGITWSYRERQSTRAPLGYFDRQEVIRFLKTQEKVLTEAMVECLDAHGIDTSDLKESLLAFINQGIINTGEIRGNVTSRIRAFFSRKARARAWGGKVRYAAG